jgi:small acid-soluble spore protein H (minor)
LNTDRAKEIINSKGVIEVLHNGAPVWIEGLRGSNAEVTYIETKKRSEVPLDRLIETHPM